MLVIQLSYLDIDYQLDMMLNTIPYMFIYDEIYIDNIVQDLSFSTDDR